MLVDVQIVSTREGLPAVMDIEQWSKATLRALHTSAQLCVRIVDEDEAAQLNESYRGRCGPTNVLSFSFAATQCTEPPLLGDIIICAPVVAREAENQHKSSSAHYAHMVVHGTLHLLGHDHATQSQAEAMEALEREIIASLGFADPYVMGALP